MDSRGSNFKVLHYFDGVSDGSYPSSSLVFDLSGNLVGTAGGGGPNHTGTVFSLKTDGSGFSVLHAFAAFPTDGTGPDGALMRDGSGNLFGTTGQGGSKGGGIIFKLTTP